LCRSLPPLHTHSCLRPSALPFLSPLASSRPFAMPHVLSSLVSSCLCGDVHALAVPSSQSCAGCCEGRDGGVREHRPRHHRHRRRHRRVVILRR
jgi:hypothetical protein